MLRSENSLNDELIEIMMEDEKAEAPVARIATPPRSSKLEFASHSRSPSPYSGNSPAGVDSPVPNFIHQPNGFKRDLLSPVPIKHIPLHQVSPTKDRHQISLPIVSSTVINHNAKSNGLDEVDKPEDGDKTVSHTPSPDANKIRQFRNRLFPTHKTLPSPHTNTVPSLVTTSVQATSGDQPPPEPIELQIYQVCICVNSHKY